MLIIQKKPEAMGYLMQSSLMDYGQKQEIKIQPIISGTDTPFFVFSQAKKSFKLFIISHILDIFRKYREDGRKLRYLPFKHELSKGCGDIIMDQIDLIVDALIDEGFLCCDVDNVMSLTCKIINEHILMEESRYEEQ